MAVPNHVYKFCSEYKELAEQVGKEYGIPYKLILAQAAIETGWGASVHNNNFFGHTGQGVLLKTREEADSIKNLKAIFVSDYHIELDTIKQLPNGRFECYGKRQFLKFDTPKQSFVAYANNIKYNAVYASAWKKPNIDGFIKEVCKHYATASDYYDLVIKVITIIENFEKQYKQ